MGDTVEALRLIDAGGGGGGGESESSALLRGDAFAFEGGSGADVVPLSRAVRFCGMAPLPVRHGSLLWAALVFGVVLLRLLRNASGIEGLQYPAIAVAWMFGMAVPLVAQAGVLALNAGRVRPVARARRRLRETARRLAALGGGAEGADRAYVRQAARLHTLLAVLLAAVPWLRYNVPRMAGGRAGLDLPADDRAREVLGATPYALLYAASDVFVWLTPTVAIVECSFCAHLVRRCVRLMRVEHARHSPGCVVAPAPEVSSGSSADEKWRLAVEDLGFRPRLMPAAEAALGCVLPHSTAAPPPAPPAPEPAASAARERVAAEVSSLLALAEGTATLLWRRFGRVLVWQAAFWAAWASLLAGVFAYSGATEPPLHNFVGITFMPVVQISFLFAVVDKFRQRRDRLQAELRSEGAFEAEPTFFNRGALTLAAVARAYAGMVGYAAAALAVTLAVFCARLLATYPRCADLCLSPASLSLASRGTLRGSCSLAQDVLTDADTAFVYNGAIVAYPYVLARLAFGHGPTRRLRGALLLLGPLACGSLFAALRLAPAGWRPAVAGAAIATELAAMFGAVAASMRGRFVRATGGAPKRYCGTRAWGGGAAFCAAGGLVVALHLVVSASVVPLFVRTPNPQVEVAVTVLFPVVSALVYQVIEYVTLPLRSPDEVVRLSAARGGGVPEHLDPSVFVPLGARVMNQHWLVLERARAGGQNGGYEAPGEKKEAGQPPAARGRAGVRWGAARGPGATDRFYSGPLTRPVLMIAARVVLESYGRIFLANLGSTLDTVTAVLAYAAGEVAARATRPLFKYAVQRAICRGHRLASRKVRDYRTLAFDARVTAVGMFITLFVIGFASAARYVVSQAVDVDRHPAPGLVFGGLAIQLAGEVLSDILAVKVEESYLARPVLASWALFRRQLFAVTLPLMLIFTVVLGQDYILTTAFVGDTVPPTCT